MPDTVKKILSVGGCVLIVAGTVLCALCYELLRRYDGHASPLIFPPAGRFFQQEKSEMRFAVFGDFRIQTMPFEAVMRSIRNDGADFALCVGDMAKKREIQHFCWLAERMKRAGGDLKIFCTPGNNDRESRDPHENGLRAYKGSFGQPGYWFAWGDSLFVSLDTSAERLAVGEFERLEEILKRERNRFNRLVVFTHVPPVDSMGAVNVCLTRMCAVWSRCCVSIASRWSLPVISTRRHAGSSPVRRFWLFRLPDRKGKERTRVTVTGWWNFFPTAASRRSAGEWRPATERMQSNTFYPAG